ncbi:GAF domain-containing protein [Dethiosulfatarculus sandiegensis]|uniref:GAF domain-containing protein n=1 Tax=Dethiosulfatarculus sandiegensis TaxID=1429043 RepID=A0A0D2J219_9BACT|nr:GAF domain-containing protein [Dethiosulfatarculus sandiegensis]KIX12279.1 hypothetical protein X474_19955 [Dethiosulfatarculus sandiegensis]
MSAQDRIDHESLRVICQALGGASSLEVLADNMNGLLTSTLGIKGSTLFVLNPNTRELELLASFGLSNQFLNKGPVIADKSLAQAMEGQSVIIPDTTVEKDLQYPEETHAEGIKAIVSLPMLGSGEVLGVLRLYHDQVWEVSQHDHDILLLLAENIGLAMRYTRVLNALQSIWDIVSSLPDGWERF